MPKIGVKALKNAVTFREDLNTGDMCAVFLDQIHNHNNNQLVCYARVGQHGACSIDWLYNCTKPVDNDETNSLMRELVHSCGYKGLVVKYRLPRISIILELFNNQKREVKR